MILYDSKKIFYKNPFGAVAENTDLFFRIKTTGEQASVSAQLVLFFEDDAVSTIVEGTAASLNNPLISPAASEKPGQVFEFPVRLQKTGLYFYHFETVLSDGTVDKTPEFQLTVYSSEFSTPDWLRGGLMYQIFPDRFARSADYIPPQMNKNYILRNDWGGMPVDKPDSKGIVQNNDFFGGNLKGIQEKLDHLVSLGVTVIYLNPIFEAYSNHRYDTANYKKIDPMLGTEDDFSELCKTAAEKGIRIILDGVFNHTGSDSLYFNKNGRYPELGAYQSKDSPYYPWYRFIEFPGKYEAWWGIDTLPGVTETEPTFLDYIIRSEDSVIRHWLKCGASGFRLDVADELPDEFLEELRKAIKETKSDAAVIGEVWEDASNKIAYGKRRRYFLGGQLDTVMNYPLKDALIDYLLQRINGVTLEQNINSLWENYPQPAFRTLMNIMGTHDTRRILTVLGENSRDYEHARQRLFLDLMITAFMPGIPCIYYGDEIGMLGEKDPCNRSCFEPEKGDPYILRFYRRLFAFRKKISELDGYLFRPRSAEGSFYSYERVGSDRRLIVAANAGNQDHLLNLAMKDRETLKDFFLSGSVLYERQGVFRIRENSGIVAWIEFTK
jgi:4-alpha-glucanotransferase